MRMDHKNHDDDGGGGDGGVGDGFNITCTTRERLHCSFPV
jgi:hypothetical protein